MRSASNMIRPSFAGWRLNFTVAIVYAMVFAIVVMNLPRAANEADGSGLIVAIGLLAIWRYGWWGVHVVRSILYVNRDFPRLRKEADQIAKEVRAEEIYVLITSYRMAEDVTMKVYTGLIEALVAYGAPAKIVASVTDQTDVDLLSHVIALHGHLPNIKIRYMFQKGDGKRSAMAEALRAIARDLPSPDARVVLMDGDILLPANTLERSLGFFDSNPELGALTTDNRGRVRGDGWTREWYDLRYAQRHLVMSSMSLSRRLLVLTGRFSVFRASIVTRRDFIEYVESDRLKHWRFGTFRFLSGDDKSTWFWLLKQRYQMIYLPDVTVFGFEELPDRRKFVASSVGLMRRWYGNMLRNNGRAVALGPREMGFFTWWSLIDQRLSMWTSLTGPIVAIMLTIAHNRPFFLGYICWIMMTRIFASVLLGAQRGRFSPLWPVLLYYNQLVGALVKTWVTFRVNQQKWTRQNIVAGEPADPFKRWRQRQISHALHTVQFTAFVYALALMTGLLKLPATRTVAIAAGSVERPLYDDYWMPHALANIPKGGWLQLSAGDVHLAEAYEISGTSIAIRGAGAGRTNLISYAPMSCADPAVCIESANVVITSPAGQTMETNLEQ